MQDTPHGPVHGITASLTDGTLADVELLSGPDGVVRVATIAPVSDRNPRDHTARADPRWLDLRDFVLTASAAEPHAHLDKAFSWTELNPPLGDLDAAITVWRAGSVRLDEESFRRRATRAITTLLRNGITAVRTHVDVPPGPDPLRATRALVGVREAMRDLVTIQIVALANPLTPTEVVVEALDAGADLVGGAPHIADDPRAEVARLVGLAESRGVGIDLHTDEFLDGDHHTIDHFADRVADWPADRLRTAGHCCRLDTMPLDELERVADALARASVSVVALPITNLYLQGRQGPSKGRRGITAIDVLRDRGVLVTAGADNIRDPFNPVGRADPLETASLLVTAGHQSPYTAMSLVTDNARTALGLPVAGPVVGARADFLAVRGTDVLDTIATAPADRVVLVNGSIVARTETTTWTATPAESRAGATDHATPAPYVLETS
ncbi:amidohydrolase family protein [Gordonia amicalis]|nr:amidohydrolase family protein [Gordonia amicalis]